MAADDLKEHQRFSLLMEQSIRMANREVLHPIVDPLTDEKVLAVAVEVARRRAAYVYLTLKLGQAGEHHPTGDELNAAKNEYMAARDAFAELMHTIEQGYVDLPERKA
jgi:hypothetical protein